MGNVLRVARATLSFLLAMGFAALFICVGVDIGKRAEKKQYCSKYEKRVDYDSCLEKPDYIKEK